VTYHFGKLRPGDRTNREQILIFEVGLKILGPESIGTCKFFFNSAFSHALNPSITKFNETLKVTQHFDLRPPWVTPKSENYGFLA
jgi:hypothetical protein